VLWVATASVVVANTTRLLHAHTICFGRFNDARFWVHGVSRWSASLPKGSTTAVAAMQLLLALPQQTGVMRAPIGLNATTLATAPLIHFTRASTGRHGSSSSSSSSSSGSGRSGRSSPPRIVATPGIRNATAARERCTTLGIPALKLRQATPLRGAAKRRMEAAERRGKHHRCGGGGDERAQTTAVPGTRTTVGAGAGNDADAALTWCEPNRLAACTAYVNAEPTLLFVVVVHVVVT